MTDWQTYILPQVGIVPQKGLWTTSPTWKNKRGPLVLLFHQNPPPRVLSCLHLSRSGNNCKLTRPRGVTVILTGLSVSQYSCQTPWPRQLIITPISWWAASGREGDPRETPVWLLAPFCFPSNGFRWVDVPSVLLFRPGGPGVEHQIIVSFI